jgi:hypothetical protein
MLGMHHEALRTYQVLVERGVEGLAHGDCGEGKAWARGLVADCHLRMSDSWMALGAHAKSVTALDRHLDLRGPGCRSIYKLEELSERRARLRGTRKK